MKQFFYNVRSWLAVLIAFLYLLYIDLQLSIKCILRYKNIEQWITAYLPHHSKMFFYIFRIAGIRCNFYKNFSVQGGPYLVIANHQSFLDILAAEILFQKHGIRFVAKEQLGNGIPYLSKALRIQRHCLIDRNTGFQSIKIIKKFAYSTKTKKTSMLVFPEGTRSRNGTILPFHNTAVRVIAEINPVPVVVLAIDGYKFSKTISFKNFVPFTYRMKMLKIFSPPKNQHEMKQYTEEARIIIKKQVEEWHAEDAT